MRVNRSHPAKFPRYVLDRIALYVRAEARALGRPARVLDPFAGVGRIHDLPARFADTTGVEIEPEWAACRARTIVGDATALPPEWSSRFDAVITSPCLEQSHRVLTNDLRWVAVGDLVEGDELLTFDEHGPINAVGTAARRRWQRAVVLRSVPRRVECVRVILENGDELLTTPEHPWLTSRYQYGGRAQQWVTSRELMGSDGIGRTRGHQLGRRQPYYVLQQLQPWRQRCSYDAGWLAGMFDGEGSLSLGVHGSPKLTMCQVDGPVIDRAERLMHEFGYHPNRIARRGVPEHRSKISNLYVTGGFPGILRALGELRPMRLLTKWEAMDVSTRTVEAAKVAVLAVEPAGRLDIQEIETSSGTYIGEGYLHHNCYGNRLADHHEARDSCKACQGAGVKMSEQGCDDAPMFCPSCHRVDCTCGVLAKELRAHAHSCRTCRSLRCDVCNGAGISKRYTYRHALRRMPSAGSAGAMQWGLRYKALHAAALAEMHRVLRYDGLVLVNMKNHMRDGHEQHVVAWWAKRMRESGFEIAGIDSLEATGMRHGENAELRVEHERLIVGRKR